MKFEHLLHEIIIENIELGEGVFKTQDQFLSDAHKVHDEARISQGKEPYDYSKVNYVNNKTKVEIICPEHGPFFQTPAGHNQGYGCPICGKESSNSKRAMDTELFINMAHAKHDEKRISQGKEPYDYSKVKYKNNHTKVEIICPEHGPFFQTPGGHLHGYGCIKCGGTSNLTQDEFIKKAREINDPKRISQGKEPYDYSKVKYKNSSSDVEVICPKHGSFFVNANSHMTGKSGCPMCAKIDSDEFISDAHKVHDAKRISQGKEPYDYSKVKYKNNHTKVEIICPEHGPFFQTPKTHKKGSGCPKCAGVEKLTQDEFISNAHNVHDKKRILNGKEPYDYSEVNYVNYNTKVVIICHEKDKKSGIEHGEFLQSPAHHLKGSGCPICKELKGETNIREILNDNNIKYFPQYSFNDCVSFKKSSVNKICRTLSFDFYLPKYKTLIEFDGWYHFNSRRKETNDSFMSRVVNDREKNRYTKENGYKLIRISHLDINNLQEEIRNGLLSKDQLYLSKSYGNHTTGWVNDNFQPTTKFLKKYEI